MKSQQGIAQKIEAAAYDVVYIAFGIVYTFWDYLFRPGTFKRLSGIARLEGEREEQVHSPYALPVTYVALSLVALFLYLPAIVGFHPANYLLLGQAVYERIGFLNTFATAVKGARLSQIVMMLVPFFVVVGMHAALMRLLLRTFGLKTSFETQLQIGAYAVGTAVFLFCVFMSPSLIREPMRAFAMQRDSAGAQALFVAVVALMAASFGLAGFRYVTFVGHSCRAGRGQWWHVTAAVSGALLLSLVIVWILVDFWFPFLVPSGPA